MRMRIPSIACSVQGRPKKGSHSVLRLVSIQIGIEFDRNQRYFVIYWSTLAPYTYRWLLGSFSVTLRVSRNFNSVIYTGSMIVCIPAVHTS